MLGMLICKGKALTKLCGLSNKILDSHIYKGCRKVDARMCNLKVDLGSCVDSVLASAAETNTLHMYELNVVYRWLYYRGLK
jgi:hypothetical protein